VLIREPVGTRFQRERERCDSCVFSLAFSANIEKRTNMSFLVNPRQWDRLIAILALLLFFPTPAHLLGIAESSRACSSDIPLSHVIGIVEPLPADANLGPNSGFAPDSPNLWTRQVGTQFGGSDTNFLMLEFTSVSLPGTSRIEVDLGYDVDVFDSSSGPAFWTRPINIYPLAGANLIVRYISDGSPTGMAHINKVGWGQSHAGDPGHGSFSNCDPFMSAAVYAEPVYDPFWFCTQPPSWDNTACVADPADVRSWTARSVGMIITPHDLMASDIQFKAQHPNAVGKLGTCSVTLIGEDQVITAGHCVNNVAEALRSSVVFDYQTDCAGNRPPGYSPKVFKVKDVLEWVPLSGVEDFMRLRLATKATGVPPLQLRPDLPVIGEQVFGIHHPNGAVKKISPVTAVGFSTVAARDINAIRVPISPDFHVSGGSSGSALFDIEGRVLGVLSRGNPCADSPLIYYPSFSIMRHMDADPVPITRDVMIVFDRSGSMTEWDSGSSRSKMEAARDAVSLFVQLVRSSVGNRLGLVSFSNTAMVEFPLADVTPANKMTLIGAAPFAAGKVGALAAGGGTSIGAGLDTARAQLTGGAGTNPRSILLMTDGMQNVMPWISQIEDDLTGIDINAVGFGTDANLESDLLAQLAVDHDGMYTRATTGVGLQKFFSQAFGDIFETGLLNDPEYYLDARSSASQPSNFDVCGETAITVVVGWNDPSTALRISLLTPSGATIRGGSPQTEEASGRTWSFLRVPLLYAGKDGPGRWNVTVFRPSNAKPLSLTYFVNIIPTGGPRLRRFAQGDIRSTYYTGDDINPLVSFAYSDRRLPEGSSVEMSLFRPNASMGTFLTQKGLLRPITLQGDVIPDQQAGLGPFRVALEEVKTYELSGDHDDTFQFESTSTFGSPLSDVLTTDGDYLLYFRAKAVGKCTYARELLSTVRVAVGIDPRASTVSATISSTGSNGVRSGTLVITPRDRYGNYLGPLKLSSMTISGAKGTTIAGSVTDNRNGVYSIPVKWNALSAPAVTIGQRDRKPVVLQGGIL
jgi:hypothetical protein